MKGVVIAAGKGSRLGEGCKALVDVRGKPLVTYPLDTLKRAGMKDVVIVQHEGDISSKLGYSYDGLRLSYVSQNERKGIAHALGLTEHLVGGESMAIVLGDVIYRGDGLSHMVGVFYDAADDARPFDMIAGMQRVDDKEEIKKSYGLKEGVFVEKPQDVTELPNLLGLGMYVASHRIFDKIRKLKLSNGEYQITDLLNQVNTYPCIVRGSYININTQDELKRARGEK